MESNILDMSTKITDELINERLEKLGFGEKQANDEEMAMDNVLKHFGVEITDNYSIHKADFSIYEESTADGYEVWVATHDMNHVNVSENVYYYDSDLSDVLVENIRYCNGSEDYPHVVYVSDVNHSFVEQAMQELFVYLSDRLEEEVVEQLEKEGYEPANTEY